jgi:hypothetical protein
LAQHIGLYNIKEIAGGLWRNDYWAYNRKAQSLPISRLGVEEVYGFGNPYRATTEIQLLLTY